MEVKGQQGHYLRVARPKTKHCINLVSTNQIIFWLASLPGLLTPAFVAHRTNEGEGLVKLATCNDIHGCVEEWYIPAETTLPSFTHTYRVCAMRLTNNNGLELNRTEWSTLGTFGDVSRVQKAAP